MQVIRNKKLQKAVPKDFCKPNNQQLLEGVPKLTISRHVAFKRSHFELFKSNTNVYIYIA
jgi:hypothetical protein